MRFDCVAATRVFEGSVPLKDSGRDETRHRHLSDIAAHNLRLIKGIELRHIFVNPAYPKFGTVLVRRGHYR